MGPADRKVPQPRASGEIDAFLEKIARTPARAGAGRGRLIFAIDATASRQPTWDRACRLQGEMFHVTKALGGLDVQLVYYRGFHEFEASAWAGDADALVRAMTGVLCLGGETQIEAVLRHAAEETARRRVNALVFVGDCMEEDADRLCALAGELGLKGLPIFVFHEGGEPNAGATFRQMARVSGGAYCAFDAGSADQLRALLSAIAVFAAGGLRALEDLGTRAGGEAAKLLAQVRQLGAPRRV